MRFDFSSVTPCKRDRKVFAYTSRGRKIKQKRDRKRDRKRERKMISHTLFLPKKSKIPLPITRNSRNGTRRGI